MRAVGQKYTGWVAKRGQGIYQAVVNLGPNPDKPGRYITTSRTVRGSRGDAAAYLRDWLNQLELEDQKFKPSDQTLGEWLIYWVENNAKNSLERNTYENYKWEIERHINPMIGHALLAELNPLIIKQFYDEKARSGRLVETKKDSDGNTKKPPGLSNRSINLLHTILNQALKEAVSLEMIESNPCEKAKPPRDKKKKRKSEDDYVAISKDELIKFLYGARGHRDFAIIYTAGYSGARQSELLGLRREDILWKINSIRIQMTLHRHKDGSYEHRPRTKNDSSTRTIKMTKNDMAILKWHLAKQDALKLAAGPAWKDKFDLVFTEPDGEPMDRRNLTQRFGSLASRLGHPGFTFHGLRHTHATILLADGEYINSVSKRLGHADIDTTLKVYGHVLPKMREETADHFQRLVPLQRNFFKGLM